VRCTRHPQYWYYNTLRVETAADGLSAEALARAADALQGDLQHRRIEVEHEAAGARLRRGFDALGWVSERLAWLRLGSPPDGPDLDEVPITGTRALRLEWARAEAWTGDEAEMERQADAEEDVARLRGARAVVARDPAGEPIGYVMFSSHGGAAEIEQAYVTPSHRGRGTGGALVAAAARAAGAAETFIVADDEGDSKRLYERLGFEPVWMQHQFTRRPR
jgi:ribosomal protein S18 acetylase RimI-like enzyme